MRVAASLLVLILCGRTIAQARGAETAPAPRDIRVEIGRAETLLGQKEAARALDVIAAAIASLKPEGELDRAARRTQARALVDLGRFVDAAPVILASYGIEGAAAASSLALAARGYAERNERGVARALLLVAALADPKRDDLVKIRAALAIEDGDGAGALRDADRFLVRLPADAGMRRIRAQALHALGRSMEARDALAALDRVAPLDATLVRVLAALDVEAGLIDDAETLLARLGPLASSDIATLARVLIDRGDPRAALALVARYGAGSDDAGVARLRARAHLEIGEPAQAAGLLGGIAAPSIQDQLLLAKALRLAGDAASAAKIVEALLASDAANVHARAELFAARMTLGDMTAARGVLRDGLVLAPSDPTLVRLLDDLVIELGAADATPILAVLAGDALYVDGAVVAQDAAAAVRQMRALRGPAGSRAPSVRLMLDGSVDARSMQRALDLFAAAGLARMSVEAK